MTNITLEEDICLWKTDIVCDPDLHELCLLLMGEHHLEAGHDAAEASRLYRQSALDKSTLVRIRLVHHHAKLLSHNSPSKQVIYLDCMRMDSEGEKM